MMNKEDPNGFIFISPVSAGTVENRSPPGAVETVVLLLAVDHSAHGRHGSGDRACHCDSRAPHAANLRADPSGISFWNFESSTVTCALASRRKSAVCEVATQSAKLLPTQTSSFDDREQQARFDVSVMGGHSNCLVPIAVDKILMTAAGALTLPAARSTARMSCWGRTAGSLSLTR